MEPLIRLRALTSQLDQNELNRLIQNIIKTFGNEQIISFIFNHFLTKYTQTKTHSNDLHNIIKMTSNIIESRNKDELQKKNNEKKPSKMSIDSIPPEMVRECASYLQIKDYLHFSECNRQMYIACHSPSSLQEFYAWDYNSKDYGLLNQFPSLKHLSLSVDEYNNYIDVHQGHNPFPSLDTLALKYDSDNDTQALKTFLSTKYINFNNITTLYCTQFGDVSNMFDFDMFCSLLSKFPNVEFLKLSLVFLTEFNENQGFGKMLPNLQTLYVYATENENLYLLRNKLLNIYSKQMIAVGYDDFDFGDTPLMNVVSFPKLKELGVVDPNMHTLHQMVRNTNYLERLNFEISEEGVEWGEMKMKEMIIEIFRNYPKLEHICFSADWDRIQKIMEFIEIAMSETRCMRRSPLKTTFSVLRVQEIDRINLHILRLINAFDVSNVENYMIGFHIHSPKQDKTSFNKGFEQIKATHLVAVDSENHACSIFVSNNDCTINGYSTRWVLFNLID